MANLKIKNWETWQTYRKDRSTPPWIKIYRRLLLDPQWNMLTDAQKGQLVSLWLLAADRNGVLTDDPRMLRKLCQLDNDPDIETFVSLGFIERLMTTKRRRRDNQELKPCQPTTGESDAPEESRVEESRVEEKRGEGAPPALTPLAELFNSRCSNLPEVKAMSRGRREKERIRLKEQPDLAWWASVFDRVNRSQFCQGKNDRGWVATFDWIIANDGNALKVYEGKYDNREPKGGGHGDPKPDKYAHLYE